MARPVEIEDYLRLFNMKHHQGNYDPKLPKEVSENLVEDSYHFVREFKQGKGTNWTMEDVRDAIDDRIQEVFDELDDCDKFTLQMSDRAPEHAQEWNTVERNQ